MFCERWKHLPLSHFSRGERVREKKKKKKLLAHKEGGFKKFKSLF